MTGMGRRAVLGAGSVAAAGAMLGGGSVAAAGTVFGARPVEAPPVALAQPSTPAAARQAVATSYRTESTRSGGTWHAYISVANPDGTFTGAVAQRPHDVVQAYSVNKIAVAVTVLDKVDRGLLRLDQTVQVTESIILQEGIFYLDRAYPSQVTLGHVIAAMLTVSDNTSVRLCGLVAPAAEINQILWDKGFRKTQVEPVANPNRFFLGFTSAWETHKLLWTLVREELLSPSSTDFLLTVLRSPAAFTDGIRREMSSAERLRIATKAGWFADGRNEAGIIFDPAGAPVLTFSMFATSTTGQENFGATNPLVAARARMGRPFLSAVNGLSGPAAIAAARLTYRPSNGG